jgi:hypothetical protein
MGVVAAITFFWPNGPNPAIRIINNGDQSLYSIPVRTSIDTYTEYMR